AELQAVFLRICREFGAPEQGGDVHFVELVSHPGLIDGFGLLNGMLQYEAGRIAARRVITGLDFELVGKPLRKLLRGWSEVRLERNLRLPLGGHRNAGSGVAKGRKIRAVWGNEQGYPFQIGLLVVELTGKRGAVGVVAAAKKRVRFGRNHLVDDWREVGRA